MVSKRRAQRQAQRVARRVARKGGIKVTSRALPGPKRPPTKVKVFRKKVVSKPIVKVNQVRKKQSQRVNVQTRIKNQTTQRVAKQVITKRLQPKIISTQIMLRTKKLQPQVRNVQGMYERTRVLRKSIQRSSSRTYQPIRKDFTIAVDVGRGRMQDFHVWTENGRIVKKESRSNKLIYSPRFIDSGRVGKSMQQIAQEKLNQQRKYR